MWLTAACGADGASGPDQSSRLPIAYSYNADGIYERRIYFASADGKTIRPAFDIGGDQAIPEWAPDGRSLLLWRELGVSKAFIVNEDGSGLREVPGAGSLIAGWSPDGAWIVSSATGPSGSIEVMHADGSGRRTVVSGLDAALPAWSVNGRIAFNRTIVAGGAMNLWAVDVDGSNLTQLTTGNDDEYPAWSPDGKQLAFMMGEPSADGFFDHYVGVVNADGSGRRRVSTVADSYVRFPRWSPDGQWILYERYTKPSTGGCSFAKVPASGGTPTTVIPATKSSVCGGASWR